MRVDELTTRSSGRIMLKGDNITLIQTVGA